MALDLTEIQTFADSDILNILRQSLVNSALAKTYMLNGRSVETFDPGTLQKLIGIYEWRIARATGGIFTAAQFRRPE